MRTFFIFIIFTLCFQKLSLLTYAAPLSQNLQTKCAALLPEKLKHRALAQSFLCGTRLSNPREQETFRATGLLHLMVVSGSHLQLLAFFLLLPTPQRWRRSTALQSILWSVLFLYCFATGFQAPIVRAFTSRVLVSISHSFHLHLDFGKIQIASGLFLLSLFPEWISSFSFYLSWLASLGFLLAPLLTQTRMKKFKWFLISLLSCLLIQTLVSVAFLQFSWLGVATNALLAPFIAWTLFPLSIAACFSNLAIPFVDQGWSWLLQFLEWIQFSSGVETLGNFEFPHSTLKWMSLWIFLALTHCGFEALRQTRYQRSHV